MHTQLSSKLNHTMQTTYHTMQHYCITSELLVMLSTMFKNVGMAVTTIYVFTQQHHPVLVSADHRDQNTKPSICYGEYLTMQYKVKCTTLEQPFTLAVCCHSRAN